MSCPAIIIIIVIITSSNLRLFSLVIILLNQWCTPPFRLKVPYFSIFLIMCDVPTKSVFLQKIYCILLVIVVMIMVVAFQLFTVSLCFYFPSLSIFIVTYEAYSESKYRFAVKKSSKFSYKILLLSYSTFFKLFFHIFAAIIEALIIARHKYLYTLLIECGPLQC